MITTVMAYIAIRGRHIHQHRDWMIWSYVVTMGFVFFRLADELLTPMHWMTDDDCARMLAWTCGVVPLLLAEPMIQWRGVRPSHAT